MVMWRWVRSLSTSFCTAEGVTTSSPSPWMMIPEDGQGARKVKSYILAGGAIEMKPRTSGRRISNCMPIQAPKLKPPIQVDSASGWICWTQSRADRKSTRLNSSHSQISYAVFCLKKKKTQQINPATIRKLVDTYVTKISHQRTKHTTSGVT